MKETKPKKIKQIETKFYRVTLYETDIIGYQVETTLKSTDESHVTVPTKDYNTASSIFETQRMKVEGH
jgi:hypothetical protein